MVLLSCKKTVSTPSSLFQGCLHVDILWACVFPLFIVEVRPLLTS